MRFSRFAGYPLVACFALTAVACSAPRQALVPSNMTGPIAAVTSRVNSGIDSAAKSSKLVYVGQGTEVDMYVFPRITKNPVGTIQIDESGLCSDKNGNVWISSQVGKGFEMIEYPHGATNPIAQLSAGTPWGCAVDSKSGDLAVANTGLGSQNGYVAIYRKAEGNPEMFSDPNISHFYYCAFDKNGNLLAQGRSAASSHIVYAELPKGERKLQDVSGTVSGNAPAGVQWDGTYFVIGYLDFNTVYRYTVTNGEATLEGQVTFDPGRAFSLVGFSIDGSKLAGTSQSSNFYRVAAFPYPEGGVSSHHHLIQAPSGVAISVLPRS
jgi:hypothetical protein